MFGQLRFSDTDSPAQNWMWGGGGRGYQKGSHNDDDDVGHEHEQGGGEAWQVELN